MASKQQRKFKARKQRHHNKSKRNPYGPVVIGDGEPTVTLPALVSDNLAFVNKYGVGPEKVVLQNVGNVVRHGHPTLPDNPSPSRAKCPGCGKSQKVRKDGTMSRHDAYDPDDGSRECNWTGARWDGA